MKLNVLEETCSLTKEAFLLMKSFFIDHLNKLKGRDKHIFAAQLALAIGRGGEVFIAEHLVMSRITIRKAMREITSGIPIQDKLHLRHRKRAEERLPNLLDDIKSIVDSQSQTDPNFHSTRLFTRLTVAKIREQLISQKGYTDEELPSNQTLNTKVNQMGYGLKKVLKTKPLKKIEETDAIFEKIAEVNTSADADPTVLRISLDTKDKVKIGLFSRGGYSRVETKAADHDFSTDHLVPFGILTPETGDVNLYFSDTKVTADLMVDCIDAYWVENKANFPLVTRLMLNQDNGPENSSHRTQFVKRIVEFSIFHNIEVYLAYYPVLKHYL